MYEFHADRKRYFEITSLTTSRYVIPFIEAAFAVKPGMRVLEIGCGEGGVLQAFIDRGCVGVGVELNSERLEYAQQYMAEALAAGKVRFIAKDIYEAQPEADFGGLFDIIVLKDVIEHIHDQPRLMGRMQTFLKPGGVIFFGFPPWQMPFGGHQQLCRTKWLSRLPWFHLLPRPVYRGILKWKNEPVEGLMEIRDTGISIERFERICRQKAYRILHTTHFLLNPIYEWKFGWKPRRQAAIIKAIPYIRNFFTTCVYYLVTPAQQR